MWIVFFAAQISTPIEVLANTQEEISVKDQHTYEMCLDRVYGRGHFRDFYGTHIYYPDGSHEHLSEYDENAVHPESIYGNLTKLYKDGWRIVSNSISSNSHRQITTEYILERRK